jgi:hypothetical protein
MEPQVNYLSRHPWAREYLWPCSPQTRDKFHQLERMAQGLEQDDPNALQLQEEMRLLPGFPREAQLWDIITIVPETRAYSFPNPKAN